MISLDRIGGTLIAPRRIFRLALDGRGNITDLLPFAVLVSAVVAPTQAGQALLLMRADPIDGLIAFLGLIGTRMGPSFAGAVVAGALLAIADRMKKEPSGLIFDRCVDAAGYLLLPYLLLSALGGALSAQGIELWLLPHRLLRGSPFVFAVRFVVAYGGSLILLAILWIEAGTGRGAVAEAAQDRARDARDRRSGFILAALIAAAFLMIASPMLRVATGPLPPGPGVRAPDFSAATPSGGVEGLALHKGQVLLIDFWATWCPPCVASMPTLERVHGRLKDRGFSVIGVNIEPDDLPSVKQFIRDRNLSLPVAVDPGAIQRAYGVFSFPTSFLVGRDGVIRKVHHGPVSEAKLEEEIGPLLSEPAPAQSASVAASPKEAP